MFLDPQDLAKLYDEDIGLIKEYLELEKHNEELKIHHKLVKRNIKRLKKEYFDLKQSNLHCKKLESCNLKAKTFSEVRIKEYIKY